MDAAVLIGLIIAGLTLMSGGWVGLKQVRSATAADKERAAAGVRDQIKEARTEERTSCDQRIAVIQSQLEEMTSDRNAERDRANGLQSQINDRGLGPRR